MRDEGGEDNRPDPLGYAVAEQQRERRQNDRQHEELTELDADVEREQRRQQVRSRELKRLPQRERKAESMHQAKAERNHPAALDVGAHHILQRHVDDGRRDQRFDERRKPERVGGEVEGRGEQRNRMRDGERRDDGDERSDAAERNDEAEQEQQMVGAVQDVLESELHEVPYRLMPPWIETHQPGVADQLERALGATGRIEADNGDGTQPEAGELRIDRESRTVRLDRILEQNVEQPLRPHELGVVRQPRTGEVRERLVIGRKRSIGLERRADLRHARVRELRVVFEYVQAVGHP